MATPIKHLLLAAAATLSLAAVSPADDSSAAAPPTQSAVPDRMEPLTPQAQRDTANVGITPHVGDTLPLDVHFTDSTGQRVLLDDYFHHGRPVILQLGYFNCPQLCDVVSQALMTGVKGLNYEMGKDYDVLYISINPQEHWELGQRKKRTFVEEFGRPGAEEGWNFLVDEQPAIEGKEPASEKVAQAVGFNYRKVEGRDEFSHPPMIVVLSPEGKISRYFYNFQYPSALLKEGIDDARVGKTNVAEQLLLVVCYHLDEYTGKYSADYMKIMQTGGVLTVLILGLWLGRRWLKDAREARELARQEQAAHPAGPHS